jgi:hypothetical protein
MRIALRTQSPALPAGFFWSGYPVNISIIIPDVFLRLPSVVDARRLSSLSAGQVTRWRSPYHLRDQRGPAGTPCRPSLFEPLGLVWRVIPIMPKAEVRALSQAVAIYSQELRAYAEVARHEAANSPTETLNYLWVRVAAHWDQLAERTEKATGENKAEGPIDAHS